MHKVGAGRDEVKRRGMSWRLDSEVVSEMGVGIGDKSILDLGLPLVTRVFRPKWGG